MPDRILVVDIEATCWETGAPPGETSDIIEIGVTCLETRDLAAGESFSLLVRPTRSRVSGFCTRLTTLTEADLAGCGPLESACGILARDHDSEGLPWASYGDYDRLMFEKCCAELSVPYPFGPCHLNVKSLFALAAGLESEVGLGEALERLGLPFEGTPHRGVDDSRNVARVLREILAAARRGTAGTAKDADCG